MTGNSAGRKEAGRLARADGAEIAYNRIAGRPPGVIFLPGFRSDMTGDKALRLESYCQSRGHAFVRFDYTGHGESSGAFTDGTIGDWAEDATFVLDQLTDGPQILVGSSMGGWVMLLAALARPNRVVGMLGIAAAPDFTEDLIWDTAPEPVRGPSLLVTSPASPPPCGRGRSTCCRCPRAVRPECSALHRCDT